MSDLKKELARALNDPVRIRYSHGKTIRITSMAKPKKKAKVSRTPKTMWLVKGYSTWDGSYYSIYDSLEAAQRDASTGQEIYTVEPKFFGTVHLELKTK